MKNSELLLAMSLALLSGCEGEKKEPVSQAQTALPAQAPGAPAADSARAAVGERTYKGTCSICHKSGLNGAPRIGESKDWEQRLSQGNETLYSHAINGYTGNKGSMPSRGGNLSLSNEEVKAAVDFMVEHSIPARGQ